MKYSGHKEINKLVRKRIKDGWLYKRGKKHGKLFAPNRREPFIIPGSPSDCRSFKNFRGDLNRYANA